MLLTGGTGIAQTASAGSRYPFSYKNRQLIVGEGGGFTGESRAYYLLENGYLYAKSDTDSLYTRLGRKSAATTRRLFNELETGCRIKTTRFDQPGNRYQFVTWKKNRQEHTVTWGNERQPPPARFTKFYKQFMAQIPAAP
ncbi:hypothetical protein GCM10027299_43750 [Larkinella ripae]